MAIPPSKFLLPGLVAVAKLIWLMCGFWRRVLAFCIDSCVEHGHEDLLMGDDSVRLPPAARVTIGGFVIRSRTPNALEACRA